MGDYYLVLDDELLKEFLKFKRGKNVNVCLISRLLNFYKKHITNVAQLRRVKQIDPSLVDSSLERQLASIGLIGQNLADLSKLTLLKIVLSESNSNFPYVNILGDEIESNFMATYGIGANRQKAKQHIEELIKSGNKIEIYDRYLFFDNTGNINNHPSIRLLTTWANSNQNISIEIYCYQQRRGNNQNVHQETQRITSRISYIQGVSSNIQIMNFPTNPPTNYHDRYIKVYENQNLKYEIILSSGIYFLEDTGRDLTYVVRVSP